jgi:hypothetical protein
MWCAPGRTDGRKASCPFSVRGTDCRQGRRRQQEHCIGSVLYYHFVIIMNFLKNGLSYAGIFVDLMPNPNN